MLHSFDHSVSPEQPSDDPILDSLGLSVDDSEGRAFQEAAAALAYSAPVASLNPCLKDRLFEQLGLDNPESDVMALLDLSIEELKAKASNLPWEAMQEAPGFDIAIWHEQKSMRMTACFIRAQNPASFPDHYHPTEEVLVVLGGDLVEAGQAYTVGDRLTSAAGTSHQLNTTQGCLLFCIASMDNSFTVC